MRKPNFSDKHYWRNFFTRVGLVLITVVVIVAFLPRHDMKRYQYDIGKPWMYDSFIASFDFPVYKTDEVIKAEQDSLLRGFQPYYKYDAGVEREQTANFISDIKDSVPNLPNGLVAIVINKLHQLYQTGIMNTSEYNQASKDTTSMVREVYGKTARTARVTDVYSAVGAYESLLADQQLIPYRQILSRCNLNTYIVPNLTYDKERSDTERSDLLSSIPIASGMVIRGQKVIDRGDIINDYTYQVLSSFEKEMARRSATSAEVAATAIGQVVFVAVMVFLFTLYLVLFRRDYFDKPRSIIMLYALITIFPILTSLMIRHNILSVYIIPFAMMAIFIRVFMDSRTALTAQMVMVLICAIAVRMRYEFIMTQVVAALVAVYSLREMSSRAQVFKAAIYVTLSYIVVSFAIQLMQDNDISTIDTTVNTHFVVNGILLLLTYPLMFLIEKTFGFVSDVTLFELSNTNRGVLRSLSEIAPGTFQHSVMVGNLAAEIANKIDANSLLVRTGALYHDIGKMTNPVFFTENQAGVNPHDNMGYKESAKIIIGHVTEGIKIAEKASLPTMIKDFILTHHGRGLTRYFYIKYQNEHPDEVVDKDDFMYPGPNPFTREQAILMMADGIEATSRSLPEYTEENISELVNKIVDTQVSDGFFKECPITFRDIAISKHVAIERLTSIYHTRIQYPELKKGAV